jgi:hypothetical protein
MPCAFKKTLLKKACQNPMRLKSVPKANALKKACQNTLLKKARQKSKNQNAVLNS